MTKQVKAAAVVILIVATVIATIAGLSWLIASALESVLSDPEAIGEWFGAVSRGISKGAESP